MKNLMFFALFMTLSPYRVGAQNQHPLEVDLGSGFCQLTRKNIEKTKVQALKTAKLQETVRDLEARGYTCELDPDQMIGHGIRGPWLFKNTLKFFCREEQKTAKVFLRMTGDFENCNLYLQSISVSEY